MKFLRYYLITTLVVSAFHWIALGAPGILTIFATGDVSGKGGANLPSGALVLTVPLDIATAPLQLPILASSAADDIKWKINRSRKEVEMKSIVSDLRRLKQLVQESQTRELSEVEIDAVWQARESIWDSDLTGVIRVVGKRPNCVRTIFRNHELTAEQLELLFELELQRFPHDRGRFSYDYSSTFDELAELPNTPMHLLEKIAEISTRDTREKANKTLAFRQRRKQGDDAN